MAKRPRAVRLTPTAYELLEQEARRRGIDPEALVEEMLRADLGGAVVESLEPAAPDLDELQRDAEADAPAVTAPAPAVKAPAPAVKAPAPAVKAPAPAVKAPAPAVKAPAPAVKADKRALKADKRALKADKRRVKADERAVKADERAVTADASAMDAAVPAVMTASARRWMDAGVIVLAVAAAVAIHFEADPPVRAVLVLAAFVLVPGWALVSLLRSGPPAAMLGLAIGLSFTIEVAGSLVLVWTGRFDMLTVTGIVGALAVMLLIADLLRQSQLLSPRDKTSAPRAAG